MLEQGSPSAKMTGLFIREGEAYRGHAEPCDNRGKTRAARLRARDAVNGQPLPEAGRGRKDPFLQTLEGARPCCHPEFRLPVPSSVREHISIVPSHPMCGAL